jgi:hypothetical protein
MIRIELPLRAELGSSSRSVPMTITAPKLSTTIWAE